MSILKKIHFKEEGTSVCGTNLWGVDAKFSDEPTKVTCKKCHKILRNRDCKTVYDVSYLWESWGGEYQDLKTVTAPTASAAIYKVFKEWCYNDDNTLGEEFKYFIKYSKPTARLSRDANISFTEEEEYENKKKDLELKCIWWNENCKVGSQVLFHRDGSKTCELKVVERPVFVASNNGLGIFLVGVSGYYHLSPEFVRPLKGNEHLIGKSLKDDGAA